MDSVLCQTRILESDTLIENRGSPGGAPCPLLGSVSRPLWESPLSQDTPPESKPNAPKGSWSDMGTPCEVGQTWGLLVSPVGPWSKCPSCAVPFSAFFSVAGSGNGWDTLPSLESGSGGNLLTTTLFGVGLCKVLPFPGVVFSGQEDGKQDWRIVLLFTCLTNNASKLSRRMMLGYVLMKAFDLKKKHTNLTLFKRNAFIPCLYSNVKKKKSPKSNFSFIRLRTLVPIYAGHVL